MNPHTTPRLRPHRRLAWFSASIALVVLTACAAARPVAPAATSAPVTAPATAAAPPTHAPTGTAAIAMPSATVRLREPTRTPTAEATTRRPRQAIAETIQAVEQRLLPAMYLASESAPYMDLAARMEHYRTPGVSIAVIDDGEIEWAKGYGVKEAGSRDAVDVDTLFQAASISKPVTALTALRLVGQGVLTLDEDVSMRLQSWQLPETELTQREKVTLRRLLNHTAGVSVNGFAGYAPEEPLPTAAQILAGQPPANSRPVRVVTTPGERWNYSGGGYVLIQQLIEDVAGKPFADVVREQVLLPLGMTHSTSSQPLAADLAAAAASGHMRDGQALPGRWRVYPELAPAGVWSTPSDIARLVIAIQEAADGKDGAILSPELAKEMLSADLGNWGLGVQLGGSGEARWFAHGGSNAGYRARMIGFLSEGKGAVVMTNGDAGIDLFNEILRAIADVYDWPDLKAQAKTVANVDGAVLQSLAGRYDIVDDPGYGFDIEATDNALEVTTSDGTSLFQPESDLVYFDLESGLQILFRRDASGAVNELETRLPTGSGVVARRIK